MLYGRRTPVQQILPLVTCCAAAGCLVVAGCMPTASSPPGVERQESRAVKTRSIPVPSMPRSATFAERIDAFPASLPVHESFDAALGYAAPAAAGPFVAGKFVLRDSFADRTGSIAQAAAAPAAATMRSSIISSSARTPTRGASLDPFVAVPTEAAQGIKRAPRTSDISSLVTTYAEKHGVPVALAHAVVQVESNYKPHLTGKGATLGLMQIKHATARGMGYKGTAKELYEPATNLRWGMKYLGEAKKLAGGSECGMLSRYNGGHGTKRMIKSYCGKVQLAKD